MENDVEKWQHSKNLKKNFFGIFLENFLKMGIGGPGPGQAAGTVWRPKILQDPKKLIFQK